MDLYDRKKRVCSGNLDAIPLGCFQPSGNEFSMLKASLESGVISGDGPFTRQAEKAICELLHVDYAFLTPSGTAALDLAALLLDVSPGDEVILPSFTFPSTANAFCLRGMKPVFVDIRQDTLNLDENLIQEAITSRTKVIVPVHYAGVSCNMKKIMEVAEKHNLLVIEDAAQAFAGTYKGCHMGAFGQIGCFSFHDTKTFSCGEGGVFVTNDSTLAKRAEILRDKGTDRSAFLRDEVDFYTWRDVGSSYVVSDLVASVLLAQIEAREIIVKERKRLFERYTAKLANLVTEDRIEIISVPSSQTINYHMFWMLAADQEERDALLRHLREQRIGAAFHYIPLHTSPQARSMGIEVTLPVTEMQASRLIRLPLFRGLTDEQQNRVTKTIHEFYHGCS